MVDLTDALDLIPAQQGDKRAAIRMIQLLKENIAAAQPHFNKYVFKYAIDALTKILDGDDPAHALLLKHGERAGKRKNFENDEVALDLAACVLAISEAKKWSRERAIKVVARSPHLRQGKTYESIRAYCKKWFPVLLAEHDA
jgi:hypothetical protein